MMRHRDAWAEQATAPTRAQALAAAEAEAAESEAQRNAAAKSRAVATSVGARAPAIDDGEVLVVISKLKKFIRDQSGMNTSDNITSVLSRHLRELSVQALRVAAADGRKTVFDRDFEAALKKLSGN